MTVIEHTKFDPYSRLSLNMRWSSCAQRFNGLAPNRPFTSTRYWPESDAQRKVRREQRSSIGTSSSDAGPRGPLASPCLTFRIVEKGREKAPCDDAYQPVANADQNTRYQEFAGESGVHAPERRVYE